MPDILLDTAREDKDIRDLESKLKRLHFNYHDLRTRVDGNYRFVNVHIEIPENVSVCSANQYCDEIENELNVSYENLTVPIHVEPA